jgi:hypothetical protein
MPIHCFRINGQKETFSNPYLAFLLRDGTLGRSGLVFPNSNKFLAEDGIRFLPRHRDNPATMTFSLQRPDRFFGPLDNLLTGYRGTWSFDRFMGRSTSVEMIVKTNYRCDRPIEKPGPHEIKVYDRVFYVGPKHGEIRDQLVVVTKGIGDGSYQVQFRGKRYKANRDELMDANKYIYHRTAKMAESEGHPHRRFFCYYDHVDKSLVKPLTGRFIREDLGDSELLSRLESIGYPIDITESTFYRYLPTKSNNYPDRFGTDRAVKCLVEDLGLDELNLALAPALTGEYLYLDHSDMIPSRFLRLTKEPARIRYTGGWTRPLMVDYIIRNESLLKSYLDHDPTFQLLRDRILCQRTVSPDFKSLRAIGNQPFYEPPLELLVNLCHIVVALKRKGQVSPCPRDTVTRFQLQLNLKRWDSQLPPTLVQPGLRDDVLFRLWSRGSFEGWQPELLMDFASTQKWLSAKTGSKPVTDWLHRARNPGLLRQRLTIFFKRYQSGVAPSEKLDAIVSRYRPYTFFDNPADYQNAEQCLESLVPSELLEEIVGSKLERADACAKLIGAVGSVDLECELCGEPMFEKGRSLASLLCGHVFHQNCIDEIIEIASWDDLDGLSCPICTEKMAG